MSVKGKLSSVASFARSFLENIIPYFLGELFVFYPSYQQDLLVRRQNEMDPSRLWLCVLVSVICPCIRANDVHSPLSEDATVTDVDVGVDSNLQQNVPPVVASTPHHSYVEQKSPPVEDSDVGRGRAGDDPGDHDEVDENELSGERRNCETYGIAEAVTFAGFRARAPQTFGVELSDAQLVGAWQSCKPVHQVGRSFLSTAGRQDGPQSRGVTGWPPAARPARRATGDHPGRIFCGPKEHGVGR